MRSACRRYFFRCYLTLLVGLVVTTNSQSLEAHPGHDGGLHHQQQLVPGPSSFFHGLAHPLSGVDHLVPWIAIGLWAAQLAGVSRILLPLAGLTGFVLGSLGGLLGSSVVTYGPLLHWLAAAYGMVLAGVLFADAAAKLKPAGNKSLATICAAAGFGGLTGLLHASESQNLLTGLACSSGMLLSTASICGFGFAAGKAINWLAANQAPYAAAGGLALASVFWLLPL